MRARGLIVALCVLGALAAVFAMAAVAAPGPAGGRAVVAVIGAYVVAGSARIAMAGLRLEPQEVTVRDVLATHRLARGDVLGLAVQPLRFGFRRVAVVW